MNGMEMMLKALGINPEEIKAAVMGLMGGIEKSMDALNKRGENIDARLSRIEQHLGVEQPINGHHAPLVEILPPARKQ